MKLLFDANISWKIVFFRSGERTFFQYAFAKPSRDNINQGELRFYKKMAKVKLAMTDSELAKAIGTGELIEI